ncbi:calcium/sodium antiporter [Methanocaldococcus bathoardescens]|nr:calcium/sodium antiporter [Methanocaldococcus bathoardescens]
MLILGIGYFLLGLILLYYGSDWFVLGSERIARHFNVSNFVIGATVMAIGTSLPEILTSAYASYMHAPGISIGNAIGSCICNIGLVLGVSAIISPIIVDKNLRKNIFVYLLFVIFTAVIGIDGFSWIDGVILLILFAIYLRWTVKNGNIEEINENNNKNNPSMVFSLVLLIIGLVGVLVGAELFVDGAKKIATALNVSDKIIGFTLVAFGTSVPELMVSLVAAKRNLGGMVLGNVVGSNIADIGGALALGSLFMYLPPENLQIAILTVMSFLLYLFAKYSKIGRWQGILFLIIYIIAIASLGMG